MNKVDLKIEYPFIRLPYDVGVKNFKCTRKIIEKEMSSILQQIVFMKKQEKIPKKETQDTIKELIQRLKNLKQDLKQQYHEQDQVYECCKQRIIHLNEISKIQNQPQQQITEEQKNQLKNYHQIRLRRLIIDYLYREGHVQTAQQMIQIYNLQPYCELDIAIIQERNGIIEDLKKQSVSKAMTWCKTNKSKLQKLQSNLEFKLYRQHYITLIKQKQPHDALQFLRRYSDTYKENHAQDIEKIAILISIDPDNVQIKYPRYKHFFDDNEWEKLIKLFKHEVYNVFSLTSQSLLNLNLSTGLSCLKTLNCFEQQYQSKDKCPVCQEDMKDMADNLPFIHKQQSNLICRITGEVMDQHNPAYMLPNGQVYGKNGIQKISEQNKGIFICPQTKSEYTQDELEKIYI
ncbi:hypothetical protein PPERSA_05662 [Pseudocohnilembus persalinus]|uniref:Uncharacterized protein n=1 Tax=Pseudocohnilembus persalinus TaxID=266149 RepID=A0A0V0QQC1_PSEPJ|nr:hypothetical protein PPERSA_05662 [Pseudocohnilembus persalinus]|eukprot:KRX04401.1 hypothetical protein PPERSA_05662 [Pseudocohnilembus persalinus]